MSSPFAIFLRELRLRNRLRQHELAEELGYEQAYISALELGTRGPSKGFVNAVANKMALSKKDQADLMKAVSESGRRFVLPVEVPTDTYRFCHELWSRIESLHPAVIHAMRELVRLEDVISDQPLGLSHRTRRLKSTEAKGAEM